MGNITDKDLLVNDPAIAEGYQKAIQEMAGEAVDETGRDRPMVEVDRNAPGQEAFIKPYYQQALIQDMNEAARRQTEADARDFAANRLAGDREMLDSALANGYDYHFGGPFEWQRGTNISGALWRKGIEDNGLPSGYQTPIPNTLTNTQRPAYIQEMIDEDNRRLREMGILDGLAELRKMQGYDT